MIDYTLHPLFDALPESFRKRFTVSDQYGFDGTYCWYWKHPFPTDTYGSYYDADFKRTIGAHRYSFMFFAAEFHDFELMEYGYHVHHRCGIPNCVNPDHLELLHPQSHTLLGNSPAAKNARKQSCPFGHPYTEYHVRNSWHVRRICKTCKNASARAKRLCKSGRKVHHGQRTH